MRETDADVRAKALAARRAGLSPIVCVGETRAEREAGHALTVVQPQLQGSLPDGAPAICRRLRTGLGDRHRADADTTDVGEMHARSAIILCRRFGGRAGTRILYGGSVNPENAAELLAVENVDGALVGGASLKAEDFLAIAAFIADPAITATGAKHPRNRP